MIFSFCRAPAFIKTHVMAHCNRTQPCASCRPTGHALLMNRTWISAYFWTGLCTCQARHLKGWTSDCNCSRGTQCASMQQGRNTLTLCRSAYTVQLQKEPRSEYISTYLFMLSLWQMQQADSVGAVSSSFSVSLQGNHPYRLFQARWFSFGVTSVTKRDLSHKYPYELVKLMWNDWRLASQVCSPPFLQRVVHLQSRIRFITVNSSLDSAVETPRDNCLPSELACYLWNS